MHSSKNLTSAASLGEGLPLKLHLSSMNTLKDCDYIEVQTMIMCYMQCILKLNTCIHANVAVIA